LLLVTGAAAAIALFMRGPAVDPPPAPPPDLAIDADVLQAIGQAVDLARSRGDDPAARLRLALTYDANGFDALARRTYEQALALDPAPARTWYWLAHAAASGGDDEAALAHARRAAAIDPAYLPAQRQIGLWMLQRGDVGEAARLLGDLAARNPDDPSTRVAFARALIEQRDYASAAAHLEAAVRIVPTYLYARLLLGTAWRHLGRLDEAEAQLRQGAGAAPVYEDPWRDEVLTYRAGYAGNISESDRLLARGRIDDAVQRLQSLRAAHPEDITVLSKLAEALERADRHDEALELLQRAILIDPDSVLTHLKLSRHYERRKRLDLATDHARAAMRLSPDYAAAHLQLGRLLALQGHLAEAADAYAEAVRLGKPEIPTLATLGRLQINLRRWTDADATFARILESEPASVTAQLMRSLTLAELGRLEEASALLRQVTTSHPDHPELPAIRARLRAIDEARGGRPPT